jgi:signal transduction histidine kinase
MWCEYAQVSCLVYGYALLIRGLAVFALGLAVILVLPRSRDIPLGWSFRYVGGFAMAQSVSVWLGALQAWHLANSPAIALLRILFRLVAVVFLLWFGCYVLAQRPHPLVRQLRRLPILASLPVSLWTAMVWIDLGASGAELSRRVALGLLYLPGMVLAAIAFWQIHTEMGCIGLQVPERDARLVSFTILAEFVVVSLIVLPVALTAHEPRPWALQIASAAEFVRPLVTIALAVAVIRFLRLFDWVRERRIAAIENERAEALRKAEEAQTRLEQEISRWSAQLAVLTRWRATANHGHERDMVLWRESVEAVSMAYERERISQELHDRIAQLLGYLHLRAQSARQALAAGRVSEASLTLQHIERLAEMAYSEVREAILGLRSSRCENVEEALRQYLAYYQERWRIGVEWSVEDRRALQLSPLVELQMVCVIQEALTNVRKHAQADRVRLVLTAEGDWAVLTIQDDGIGFDPERTEAGHFGLQIMQERCQNVGGQLRVESEPGQGTRLEIRLPLQRLAGIAEEA